MEQNSWDPSVDRSEDEDENIAKTTQKKEHSEDYYICWMFQFLWHQFYNICSGNWIKHRYWRASIIWRNCNEKRSNTLVNDDELSNSIIREKWKAKPIGCNRVLRRNEWIPKVEPKRFKAQFVTNAFSKEEAIYYHEVFTLFVKHKMIRVMLTMMSALTWSLSILMLKKNISSWLFRREDLYFPYKKVLCLKNHVCWSKNSLWFGTVSTKMVQEIWLFNYSQDYNRNYINNCVYSNELFNSSYIYMFLYMDVLDLYAQESFFNDIASNIWSYRVTPLSSWHILYIYF